MRFCPNPNSQKPDILDTNVICDIHVGMYEYINPSQPQKPYFILYNTDLIEDISNLVYPLHIKYCTHDGITHIVLNDVYCNNGIEAQVFYDIIVKSMNIADIRPNSRLYGRYVKLMDVNTSITCIDNCSHIDISLFQYDTTRVIYDYILYYIPNLKWLLPSYLIHHSNSQLVP